MEAEKNSVQKLLDIVGSTILYQELISSSKMFEFRELLEILNSVYEENPNFLLKLAFYLNSLYLKTLSNFIFVYCSIRKKTKENFKKYFEKTSISAKDIKEIFFFCNVLANTDF